jgi:hypothetical protein
MRFVVDHPEEAQARGDRARRTIQSDYSEARIAELVRQRLDIIKERHRFAEFRQDVRALVAGYQDLVREIQNIVSRVVPAGGIVMVVSKGDDNLLKFEERTGCHFPETEAGVYVGHHPRDSIAAITALDSAIARGREYLLFPGTSLWWLDHYAEFRTYLDARYSRLWEDRSCVLYDVRRAGSTAVAG